MKKLASLLASLVLAAAAAGCGSSGSPADYPANFQVVAGDGAVTVSWTAEPEVEYWIFYGPGTGITTTNWSTSGGAVIAKATSPRVISGLANGTTYSFTINARRNGGPGGSGAPTQVATPQLAGANWAASTPLGTGRLAGLSAGLGLNGYTTIAVGEGGQIFSAVTGQATTTPTNPAAPANLNGIAFAGVGWVAAGDNGTLLFTQDGTTWTAQTSGTTANFRGVAGTSIGGFVAVGDGGVIANGASGTTWTLAASPTTQPLYGAAVGSAAYVVVGAAGTILTSVDSSTWEPRASGTSADLRGTAYGALTTTVDGVTAITNMYVAVGAGGVILRSTDATTWTAQASPTTNDLLAVTYGTQFVAVGKAGTILTSPDGITWTARTSGTTADLTAILRTLTGYTAVGAAGTVLNTI